MQTYKLLSLSLLMMNGLISGAAEKEWERFQREKDMPGFMEYKEQLFAENQKIFEEDPTFKIKSDLAYMLVFDLYLDTYMRYFLLKQFFLKKFDTKAIEERLVEIESCVNSNINVFDEFPLIIECCGEANPCVVKLLLDRGADSGQRNYRNVTAVQCARETLARVERISITASPASAAFYEDKKNLIVQTIALLEAAPARFQRTFRW